MEKDKADSKTSVAAINMQLDEVYQVQLCNLMDVIS